jgi:polysaccharide export outer membrane protein
MLKKTILALVAAVSLPIQPILAQRDSIVIGVGDLVHVQVYDTPEMDQHVLVDDKGNAPLLFVGSVELAGKTPQQAEQAVRSMMMEHHIMQHPQVVVAIEKSGTLDVTVGGEVNHAGAFSLTTPRSIMDVIDMAGGLTALADRNILIEHRGATPSTQRYFVANIPSSASEEVMVWPGDRVTVPRAGVVYVLGEVGRPGGYSMSSNEAQMTLLQALAIAGSPTRTGIYAHIRLLRKTGGAYTIVPANVNDIKAGKAADPMLQPNDVVYVPFSYTKNFAVNSTAIVSSVGSAAIYTHF